MNDDNGTRSSTSDPRDRSSSAGPANAESAELRAEIARLRAEIAALRSASDRTEEEDRARVRAGHHQAHFEAVLGAMRDGVIVFDMEGRGLVVNAAATRINGFANPAELMRDIDAFAEIYEVDRLDGERVPVEEWPVSRVLRGESLVDCQLCTRRRDTGQQWVFDYAGEPIRDEHGKQIFAVVIARDVTEQRRVEAALREADRRKDEFLATLSHELRNPLAPIRNSLYILEHAPPGGEQAKRSLAIIDRQVSHLSRLVDDLLDVTRIARGKIRIQRESVELADLVRRAVEDQRSIFENNGIALSFVPAGRPLPIEADPTRLAQVIGNLLQNSAKFTPSGGRATVLIEADSLAGHAVIRVRDSGIGMPEETLHQLFVPFVQAEVALDHNQGGLGLGLALVKGIVELHGGSVTATSAGPGEGSEFAVRLPLAAEAAAASERPNERPSGRRRILVIEDNVDAADTLRDALEIREHTVEVAYDGMEGIEQAKAFRPDIVLCDIGLPILDGYSVARALRAEPTLRGVRLIALSGYALPEDITRANEAGFDAHLTKPPRITEIERILGIF